MGTSPFKRETPPTEVSLQPGQNPRQALKRHAERGPKRFPLTYETAAAALGMQPDSVRTDKALREILNAGDITSLAFEVARRHGWRPPEPTCASPCGVHCPNPEAKP